jgi:general secretion pathway protein D
MKNRRETYVYTVLAMLFASMFIGALNARRSSVKGRPATPATKAINTKVKRKGSAVPVRTYDLPTTLATPFKPEEQESRPVHVEKGEHNEAVMPHTAASVLKNIEQDILEEQLPLFADGDSTEDGEKAPVQKSYHDEPLGKSSGQETTKADIYLNFENTELLNFVNYIAELKKINVIPDKTMTGTKISLSIRQPLTIEGAWRTFLTILEMANFSIVQSGDVYKIISKNKKLQEALPVYINVPLATLPDTEENIRYVTFLRNISVMQVKGLLSNMLGVPSTVLEQPNVNGFIITGKSNNIKSAMSVLEHLDQTGLQESVVFMRLKRANARDVKQLFDSLMEQPKNSPLARLLGKQAESTTSYFSSTTKIIAEERRNALILLGNAQSIEKVEKFITEHIDTELKEAESPLHIYELQYADAEKIAEILSSVTSAAELETEAGQKAAQYGVVRGGVKFFKNMKFKVDKEGNRLIVASSDKQDWDLLKKTIADLDKSQPQVAIETLIVTVNVTDTKQIGTQLRNKKHGLLGKGIDIQTANLSSVVPTTESPITLLGNMLSAVTSELGSTILTFGKATGGVWGALKLLKSITNTSILSQPFITIANNATSTISVGETRRIPVQLAVSDAGTIQNNSAVGFESKKVATKITISPQINIEGIIKFNIEVSLSEFLNDRGDTQVRNLKTTAMVADGQVLVLGGFVKTKIDDSVNKTPLLGEIPILGWLFKNKKKTITKDYIFVFMSPSIIKPRQKAGSGIYTKMKLHEVTNKINASVELKKQHDPIQGWFFNDSKDDQAHKILDYANARFQPVTVDIANDPYYRSMTRQKEKQLEAELLLEAEKNAAKLSADSAKNSTNITPGLPTPLEPQANHYTHAEQQSFDHLDKILADRRTQLKNLLSEQTPTSPLHDESVTTAKREQFQSFIASELGSTGEAQ